MAHHSFKSSTRNDDHLKAATSIKPDISQLVADIMKCNISVTLTLTVCIFFKNLDLNDIIL